MKWKKCQATSSYKTSLYVHFYDRQGISWDYFSLDRRPVKEDVAGVEGKVAHILPKAKTTPFSFLIDK